MRVSAKAQYACIAMLELASNYQEPQLMQVKTIADTHGISPRFLVQILLQLKVNGLVRSVRGAAGGYQLARSPEQVTLADVINAIDDPAPAMPPALKALKPSLAVDALSSVLQDVDAKERQMLSELTLAELIRRSEASGVMYQI
jgi:Rrf2 family cysteine metabolism transcriptional repressor